MMTTETTMAGTEVTAEVTELLTVTSRLIGVLEREIEMIREMEPSEMQALQEEKIVLAAAYEARLKALRDADHGGLEALSPDLRAELRRTTERFQETLAENERMLRAAKEATDSLLGAIAEAVRKQQAAGSGYSSAGTPRRPEAASGTSMALDQRL